MWSLRVSTIRSILVLHRVWEVTMYYTTNTCDIKILFIGTNCGGIVIPATVQRKVCFKYREIHRELQVIYQNFTHQNLQLLNLLNFPLNFCAVQCDAIAQLYHLTNFVIFSTHFYNPFNTSFCVDVHRKMRNNSFIHLTIIFLYCNKHLPGDNHNI